MLILSKKFYLIFTIALLALVIPPTLSGQGVQILKSLDSVQELNSSENSTWYVSVPTGRPDSDYLKGRADITWEEYKVPGVFNVTAKEKTLNQPIDTIWIKKEFIVPTWKEPHLTLRLGILSDKDETYLNGVLLGRSGNMDDQTKPYAYDKIRIYKIPENLVKPNQKNTILIKNKKYFPDELGIVQDGTAIGPSSIMDKEFFQAEYFKIILLTVYLTVGFYFLFLFIRRRKERENFFFGLFVACLVIYQFFRNQIKYEWSEDLYTMKKMEYIVLTLLPTLFHQFIRSYFKFRYMIPVKIADVIYGGSIIYFFFGTDIIFFHYLNSKFLQPLYIVYIGFSFYFIIRRMIQKDKDAYLMIGSFMVIVLAIVLDVLSNNQVIVLPRMMGYAFIIFILSLATILANRFVRLNEEVEELNLSLEHKVEERTRELHDTLREVHALKVQQDGDYFLTSLLLNPLNTNRNSDPRVETDIFLKQKKSFEFKTKLHEIGGDICITANISLEGKPFMVFANGDAMGKSIQGAGGALVFGVVFNAVLTRTQMKQQKSKSPELWLKEAFLDLQKVFESFDGSMFISVVMGMVDCETGFLYFVNAEHPWTVLYRDGKASFLEEELVLRKIGIPENENSLYIKTFQLMPGDIVLAGSDGRDDLSTGIAFGQKIINEDERLFLKNVERGGGNLQGIFEAIQKVGALTDDFSMIKISYLGTIDSDSSSEKQAEFMKLFDSGKAAAKKGEKAQALEYLSRASKVLPHNKEINLLIGRLYFRNRDFIQSQQFFALHLNHHPGDENAVIYSAASYQATKNYSKAADLLEGLLLRFPHNSGVLYRLVKLYSIMGHQNRLIELSEKLLKIRPGHPGASRFLEKQSKG